MAIVAASGVHRSQDTVSNGESFDVLTDSRDDARAFVSQDHLTAFGDGQRLPDSGILEQGA
jgi:hypothetical protein